MNLFRLSTFYLVDLPGYGFAQANKGSRAGYRKLIEGYLGKREQLAGVVWLLDIRHDPSKDDLVFQDLLAESGRPALVVLTKADKLGRQQQQLQKRAIAQALGLTADSLQLVSSTDNSGIDELGESVLAAVSAAPPPETVPEQ
jgi:GTP-binding protein